MLTFTNTIMTLVLKIQSELIMAGVMLGGTIVGILLKILSRYEVDGQPFKHPFFITLFFFIGEALWLLLYMFDPKKEIKQQQAMAKGLNTNSSLLIFVIPAILDAIRSLLFISGVMFVPASVSNMMGALVVVMTTLLVSEFIS